MTTKTIEITCQGAATLSVDAIQPYQGTLKSLPKNREIKLTQSILNYGFSFPIFIWKHDGANFTIDGHQRLVVLRKLQGDGYTIPQLPVVWIEAKDVKEAKKKLLFAVGQYGKVERQGLIEFMDDADITDEELREFELPGIDLGDFIKRKNDENNASDTDEETNDLMDRWKPALGQLWALGDHKLICGDSTDSTVVGKLCADEKMTLMVTDPPYGINFNPKTGIAGKPGKPTKIRGGRDSQEILNDNKSDWTAAYKLTNADVWYIWHGAMQGPAVAANIEACDFNLIQEIIWNKPHFTFCQTNYHWKHENAWYAVRKGSNHNWQEKKRDQATVWDIMQDYSEDLWKLAAEHSTVWDVGIVANQHNRTKGIDKLTIHSTQKPVECMARPMRNNSVQGDLIYDPFCGSGTTIIAAHIEKRRARCIELSPKFVAATLQRFQDYTGIQPTLIGTL